MWLQRTMLSPFVNMVYAKRQNSCINGKWVIFVWLERCMRRRCCRRRHSLLTYHIFEKDALIPFDVMLFLRIPIMKFRFHFPNDFHFIEVAKLSYDFRNQMYCILIRVALLPHLLIFNQGIWWTIFVYKICLTTHLFDVIFLLSCFICWLIFWVTKSKMSTHVEKYLRCAFYIHVYGSNDVLISENLQNLRNFLMAKKECVRYTISPWNVLFFALFDHVDIIVEIFDSNDHQYERLILFILHNFFFEYW